MELMRLDVHHLKARRSESWVLGKQAHNISSKEGIGKIPPL